MATPIPYDVRKKIVEHRQSGLAYKSISDLLGYPIVSIKRIWYRFREMGDEGLVPVYDRCGRKKVYPKPVRDKVSELQDGEQGAPYLRSLLFEHYGAGEVPSERTVQRWLHQGGGSRPRGRPKSKGEWTDEPMHTLQADGKSGLVLKDGTVVSWINVADEATGSNLCTVLFPLRPGRVHSRGGGLPGHQPGARGLGPLKADQDRQRYPLRQCQPAYHPHADPAVVDGAWDRCPPERGRRTSAERHCRGPVGHLQTLGAGPPLR